MFKSKVSGTLLPRKEEELLSSLRSSPATLWQEKLGGFTGDSTVLPAQKAPCPTFNLPPGCWQSMLITEGKDCLAEK